MNADRVWEQAVWRTWGLGFTQFAFLNPAILRSLYPDVEVGVVARFPAQIEFAQKLGATRVFTDPFDRQQLIEDVCAWSGGEVIPTPRGLPMAFPGGIDVVYDTIGKSETLEVGCRVVRSRGTLVQAGPMKTNAMTKHRCTKRSRLTFFFC